jgi:16S rRNA (cytosine967-C5)-methyltransferase
MAESSIVNHAARILKLVQAGTPADQALRDSLTQDRHFTAPAERRGVSRAVFAYFRWWRWLPEKDSLQKQLAAALELQARFDTNPASIKPEALAARAVPDWLKTEMDAVPPAWLQQLQREPVLWIRTRTGSGESVAQRLGHCIPPHLPAFSFQHSTFNYSGSKDLIPRRRIRDPGPRLAAGRPRLRPATG